MFFQLDPNIFNQSLRLGKGLTGMTMRSFGFVLIPLRLSSLVSMEPFEKPFLGTSYFTINRDRVFFFKVLLDGYLSQSFFFHLVTSWVGLIKHIISHFQPQGNRCIGTKTDIKGNLCSGTSG